MAAKRGETSGALVADIGGTNARFALLGASGTPTRLRVLACNDFPNLADAIEAYLTAINLKARPTSAAIALASPVTGDKITLTNRKKWSFSTKALQRQLGLNNLTVINDFTAIALAIPALKSAELIKIGPGKAVSGAPVAVLGPGTGLGIALLVPDGKRWLPVATEGGHVTLPATDETDEALIALLRTRFGHVSAERILSGPGLTNLYDAICAAAGKPAPPLTAAEITNRAIAGTDRFAAETLDRFCAILGTVAGDLALTAGALGGVYIAGGIVPRFARTLAKSSFRRRFAAKGRFKSYLNKIPVHVVTADQPALTGLSRLLRQSDQTE
jgi:glucokinase